MADALFHVDHAGPLVSVQDSGRPGHLRFGVPASGGMDRKALALANLALGNPAGAPVIEVSLAGLRLTCTEGRLSLAVTGGAFIVEAGGRRLASWHRLTLGAGETLVIRPGLWGAWAYLAFAGRLECPRWLGSASTHAGSGLGGGVIRTGQHLRIRETAVQPERALPLPVTCRPRSRLHLVMGPQDRCFPAETLETFRAGPWQVTAQGDRMGMRLRGPALALGDALSIPSEPIIRGSVQVAGDGVPTVLLADHQTTGGYPKIATLLDDDTDGFAQLRPGQRLELIVLGADEAGSVARFRAERWAAALARRAAPQA